jgi:uncharacterized protein (TIGR01777 family)
MDQLPKVTQPAAYRIRIAGRVNNGWSDFMSNLEELYKQENGVTITTITGVVTDQAALHGLLERIRDMNLTLLSVVCDGPCTQDFDAEIKEKKMRLLIAGSHGMVGSAVTTYLLERGHEVIRLVRSKPESDEIWWDPDLGQIDAAHLEGFDGVINLASMRWPMRWTEKAKQKMRANRLATNRLLAESFAACEYKPQVFICAAGMGYYPPSRDDILTEDCPAGTSFLARLDQDAEEITAPATSASIRVVHLRMPTVLGGERLKMLGFQAGDGQQWMSWIGRDEMASIIEFALETETLSGPVNTVSPNPMRLSDFAKTATEAMGQKPGGVMPAFIVRLIMGEMGEEFLLASRRVQPAKLLAAGYRFRFPELADALRHEQAVMDASVATGVVA